MTEPGDSDLIEAIRRRDPAALLALYDRYRGVTFALAYRVLDDGGTAEEVVQDAFLLVWHKAASFDPARGSVRAWLLTILHHRAIDARRRRAGRWQQDLQRETGNGILAEPDVWGEMAVGMERDRVRAALAALPEEQRRAIELAYFDGLIHHEIASRTEAPLGTINGRLRLGLQQLRGMLVEVETPHDERAG